MDIRNCPVFGLSVVCVGIGALVAACQGSSDSASSESADTSAQTVDIQILAINDFHGTLQPPVGGTALVTAHVDDPIAAGGADAGIKIDPSAGTALIPTGGAAYLATHIKQLRAQNPNTVVVSAGDLTGASPLLSNMFRDEPTVLVMNALGLDFEAVGNHDFDRGVGELLRLQNGGCSLGDCDAGAGMFKGASFRYLAANVENTATSQTLFPPYAVRDVGGARIAFVGMTLEDTPSMTVATAVQGLEFENEVKTVNAIVPEIKSRGADAIVLLLHQGAQQATTGTYDSCDALAGDLLPILKGDPASGKPALDSRIEVVASAHTHQAYDCTIDGRIVTSAASFGRIVTKIDLTVDTSAHKIVSKKAHNVPVTRDVAPDPEVAGIVATFEAKSAPLANRVVGHIATDLAGDPQHGSVACEFPLGDIIADAQLAATKDPATGGAVAAFMNPAGVRADLVAHAPGKADFTTTYAEAFAAQPFSNNLVTVTLTGGQIATLLDQQFAQHMPKILQVSSNVSFKYTYDAASKTGLVDHASITIDGAPLDEQRTYRITVNSYLAGGGDGFAVLKNGTDRLSGMVDVDALVAYLGRSSAADPIASPTLSRVAGNGCQ